MLTGKLVDLSVENNRLCNSASKNGHFDDGMRSTFYSEQMLLVKVREITTVKITT